MTQQRALVIFDIDQTLIDAGGSGRKALNEAFLKGWQIADAMQGVALAGATDPEIVRQVLLEKLALTSPVTERMVKGVLGSYLSLLPEYLAKEQNFRVLPGVWRLLERLRVPGHCVLSLATGNIPAAARLKLAKAQLNRYFLTGGFGGDAAVRAGIVRVGIQRAARAARWPVQREKIVLIGDTVRDVRAAKAVGVRCVGVATGPDDSARLLEAGADLAVPSLEDTETLVRFIGL